MKLNKVKVNPANI